MADQPMLKGLEEIDAFRQIRDWEKLTETGDRAELTFLSDDSDLWARLDARETPAPARSAITSTSVSSPPCTSAPPKPT